jgi:hypothetical protein
VLAAEFPADTKLDTLAAALDISAGVGKDPHLSATLHDMALTGKARSTCPAAARDPARCAGHEGSCDARSRLPHAAQNAEGRVAADTARDPSTSAREEVVPASMTTIWPRIAGQVAGRSSRQAQEKLE